MQFSCWYEMVVRYIVSRCFGQGFDSPHLHQKQSNGDNEFRLEEFASRSADTGEVRDVSLATDSIVFDGGVTGIRQGIRKQDGQPE